MKQPRGKEMCANKPRHKQGDAAEAGCWWKSPVIHSDGDETGLAKAPEPTGDTTGCVKLEQREAEVKENWNDAAGISTILYNIHICVCHQSAHEQTLNPKLLLRPAAS